MQKSILGQINTKITSVVDSGNNECATIKICLNSNHKGAKNNNI